MSGQEKIFMGDDGGYYLINGSSETIQREFGTHSCGASATFRAISYDWAVVTCSGCDSRQFVPVSIALVQELKDWANAMQKFGERSWRDKNAIREALRKARGLS